MSPYKLVFDRKPDQGGGLDADGVDWTSPDAVNVWWDNDDRLGLVLELFSFVADKDIYLPVRLLGVEAVYLLRASIVVDPLAFHVAMERVSYHTRA